jgi:hypothetical protein
MYSCGSAETIGPVWNSRIKRNGPLILHILVMRKPKGSA